MAYVMGIVNMSYINECNQMSNIPVRCEPASLVPHKALTESVNSAYFIVICDLKYCQARGALVLLFLEN